MHAHQPRYFPACCLVVGQPRGLAAAALQRQKTVQRGRQVQRCLVVQQPAARAERRRQQSTSTNIIPACWLSSAWKSDIVFSSFPFLSLRLPAYPLFSLRNFSDRSTAGPRHVINKKVVILANWHLPFGNMPCDANLPCLAL